MLGRRLHGYAAEVIVVWRLIYAFREPDIVRNGRIEERQELRQGSLLERELFERQVIVVVRSFIVKQSLRLDFAHNFLDGHGSASLCGSLLL